MNLKGDSLLGKIPSSLEIEILIYIKISDYGEPIMSKVKVQIQSLIINSMYLTIYNYFALDFTHHP